jgi:hypothetical protein
MTDEQADETKRALAGGVRLGPVLIKWLEQLLEGRARRIRIASGARRLAITVGLRCRVDALCLGPASRHAKSS